MRKINLPIDIQKATFAKAALAVGYVDGSASSPRASRSRDALPLRADQFLGGVAHTAEMPLLVVLPSGKVTAPAQADHVREYGHAPGLPLLGLKHGFLLRLGLGWLAMGLLLHLAVEAVLLLRLLGGPLLAEKHAQQLITVRAVGLGLGQ